ncbi:MAG: M1 family aminopeptidase [Bacteroidota bacterium]|nr:M1 family aminopeptidase [Bacteroidota bacterium]
MKTVFCLLLLCASFITLGNERASELPSVTHYSLRLHFFPSEQRFDAEARLTIANHTQQPISEVPFLLYRLLDVQSVTDESDSTIRFSQSVQKFKEVPTWQVNVVRVEMPKPLLPTNSTTVVVKYGGSIYGYSEVIPYVRDRINEQYSLLRPDALAYPIVSHPSFPVLLESYQSKFTFDIQATVPSGFVAACSGELLGRASERDFVTFTFESKGPVQRMIIAVAKFKVLTDDEQNLTVYCLPEDEQGAVNVLKEMKKVVEFYSSLFGQVRSYKGYTVVEIPEGWGSQAEGDYTIFQAASAFKGTNISEVYHEIAHSWTVQAKPAVHRCRWFDEAFAMYFEALAIREFRGDSVFQKHMEGLRDRWLQRTASDKRNFDVPIGEYGKFELGQSSYTKGAWSLFVLHQLVGDDGFKQIIRSLLSEFADKPADFKDFQSVAERATKRNLKKFFDEWIYGAQSSQLLADKISVNELVKRY